MENSLMKIEYTPDQVKLIKSQIAPKATDNELKLFLYQCQRTGLDPLTRQIYCIHRWTKDGDKMTVQTSIDGFRVIAERSGVYAGQSEPEFIESDDKLKCCKIIVRKFSPSGQIYDASVGVAYWSEYVQLGKDGKPSGLWAKMPHTMLSKVAEALALRKAFPQDLSGLYTSDEMNQADAPTMRVNLPLDTMNQETEANDLAILDNAYSNEAPSDLEKKLLQSLVYNSDLSEDEQDKAFEAINNCTNYKQFQKIQFRLEARAKTIDQIPNPSQADISTHLRKVAG